MKENIYIDLSKCSEEQRKHIFSLLPKCINEEDYMIFDSFYNLHSDKGRWYCGSSWVSIVKTELTYPEFIKLFEDGEEETSLQIALKALEDIVNPIGYMKSQLKDGESLNGHYAIMISDKPKFYQDIAKEALEKINSKQNTMETSKNEPWNFCETPEEKCTMNYCDENGCEKSTLEQQIEKLEAEKKELLYALMQLCDLKQIKDMDGKTPYYLEQQPLAWTKAKSLIKKHKQ